MVTLSYKSLILLALLKRCTIRETTMKKFYISKELLEHFKGIYPNKLPTKVGQTPEHIAYLQGQQSVIERMEFMYEDAQTSENDYVST